jgi:hypothetical protein
MGTLGTDSMHAVSPNDGGGNAIPDNTARCCGDDMTTAGAIPEPPGLVAAESKIAGPAIAPVSEMVAVGSTLGIIKRVLCGVIVHGCDLSNFGKYDKNTRNHWQKDID